MRPIPIILFVALLIPTITANALTLKKGETLGSDGKIIRNGTKKQAANAPTRDGYNNNISPHAHAFALVSNPNPVRYGQFSERYELRDGDCGESDCNNPRYRSEISIEAALIRARFDEDIWYGWSFFNENIGSYSRSENLNLVIGQWKTGQDKISPQLKLVQKSQWEYGEFDVTIQLGDMMRTFNWGDENQWGHKCTLWNMAAEKGKWVDLVINTNFGTDEKGYLKIWVNGQLRCNYMGMITANKGTKYSGPSHRRGLYASYTSDFDNAFPDTPKPTFVAYYDEFRVGKTRDEVDIRLIEAAGSPPVD